MATNTAVRQLLSSARQATNSSIKLAEQSSRCLSTSSVRKATEAQNKLLGSHLKESDSEIYEILQREKNRQRHFINLIPSENFTSLAVLEALGSVMQSESPTTKTEHGLIGQINTRKDIRERDTTEETNLSTKPNLCVNKELSRPSS